ncbi:MULTISPECIES: MerR family transcriptional regulator [unclassified Sporosarcina]|uniref:MerR family transcriptional regulator n=1 Tax=unclassified Sporosarcina TaxID=2647733 RepID=UPI001A90FA20|nr:MULTISPECIES: MerR family transcriptional regulator [unclassified Sporosarcina]MBO0589260.1 MerR family transcriptional regulator [Sporosarcina sp. E16_8]MBO0601967.1 MerR family transcriptional regulator [Sporosarcina sp. E16_3]
MDSSEKKEELLRVFKDDPLWRHIETLSLQNRVFENEEFLESIIWGIDYTTTQVAKMLNVTNNQTIINLLNRHDLKEYVQIPQSDNGYYSFDHIAIFQLRLILVLRDNGQQPKEIATIIGTKTQYSRGEFRKKTIVNENGLAEEKESTERIVELKVQQALESILPKMSQELLRYKNHYENSLIEMQIENGLSQWEIKMRSIVNQIELFETQMEVLTSHPTIKPNIFTKIFSLQNEPNEIQVTKLQVNLKEKVEKLVSEKRKLEVEKTALLEQQIKLKKISETATLDFEDN